MLKGCIILAIFPINEIVLTQSLYHIDYNDI